MCHVLQDNQVGTSSSCRTIVSSWSPQHPHPYTPPLIRCHMTKRGEEVGVACSMTSICSSPGVNLITHPLPTHYSPTDWIVQLVRYYFRTNEQWPVAYPPPMIDKAMFSPSALCPFLLPPSPSSPSLLLHLLLLLPLLILIGYLPL